MNPKLNARLVSSQPLASVQTIEFKIIMIVSSKYINLKHYARRKNHKINLNPCTKEVIVYIQEYSPFYQSIISQGYTINYQVYSNTNFNTSENTVKR